MAWIAPALALAVSVAIRLPVAGTFSRLGVLVLLGATFAAVVRVAIRALAPRLKGWSRRGGKTFLAGAAGGAILLVAAVPLAPTWFPVRHVVDLTALGERNPASQGSEVWVSGPFTAGGARGCLQATPLDGDWQLRPEGVWLASGAKPGTLRFSGLLDGDAELRLTSHPWSGRARVTVDGDARTFDLYRPEGKQVLVPIRAVRSPMRWLGLLADVVTIAMLLYAAALLLASWPGPPAGPAPRPIDAVWMAALCAVVWSSYLLAFYPGVMTPDSFDQWQQMTTGSINNAHPAFHTMLNWLLTRAWRSPAAVGVAQIFGLAAATGLALRELGEWGVPRWVRASLAVGMALWPPNGVMTITLWKDIPYAAGMVALSALLLQLARTRGEALASRRFFVGLVLLMAFMALIRHNGMPTIAPLLLLLCLLLPRPLKRRGALLAAAVVGTVFLVRVPLYRAVGVPPMPAAIADSLILHQVGAVVREAPETLSSDERALLETIAPLPVWRDDYDCLVHDPLLFDPRIHLDLFATDRERDFVRLWWRQALRHPLTLAEHLLCASSHVWRVRSPGHQPLVSVDIEPNTLGLEQRSYWPAAKQVLRPWLLRLKEPAGHWWMWRTAAWLYAAIFVTLVAAARLRSGWVMLWLAGPLLNSLVLMAVTPSQDYRYQYPVQLVALLSPALAFVRRLK